LVTRGIFIFAGIQIIDMFRPILYLFGAFLVWTGIKLLKSGDDDEPINPEDNIILKYANKYLSIKKDYVGSNFFTIENGKRFVTPLFIVLLVIESTDILFAFDSVPAVLSISQDRFIIYTSNIFAILGLRALFFVIARIMPMFTYLNYGLAIVLSFIGLKMILTESNIYPISTNMSLIVVLGCLSLSVIASIIFKKGVNKCQ
jgi:tellurite resistance protein TerC